MSKTRVGADSAASTLCAVVGTHIIIWKAYLIAGSFTCIHSALINTRQCRAKTFSRNNRFGKV